MTPSTAAQHSTARSTADLARYAREPIEAALANQLRIPAHKALELFGPLAQEKPAAQHFVDHTFHTCTD